MNQQIIPMLAYVNGVEAMNWLCEVFGFTEKTRWLDDAGRLSHGEIAMGDYIVMLAEPSPHYQSPKHHAAQNAAFAAAKWFRGAFISSTEFWCMLTTSKAIFKTAQAGGATILSAIETGGPGTRYRAEDLEGQRWMFMQKP